MSNKVFVFSSILLALIIKFLFPDICFIQNPLVSNDNSWIFTFPKNNVSKFSYFLFINVENGFKTIIEKSPTKKKHTKIGERIFHNETPEALEIT